MAVAYLMMSHRSLRPLRYVRCDTFVAYAALGGNRANESFVFLRTSFSVSMSVCRIVSASETLILHVVKQFVDITVEQNDNSSINQLSSVYAVFL